MYHNIKYNLNEVLKHLYRYKKLFSNKSNYFIQSYLNIIINKLNLNDPELSVLLILIPKLTFAGKLPWSKSKQKFNKINLIKTDYINMKKDLKNGFLLNENQFDNIEKLIINFNEFYKILIFII